MRLFFLFSLLVSLTVVTAWDQLDFNIFDLADALTKETKNAGETFYSILDIGNDATTQEISKAYRKLSRTLHPDKNPKQKTLYTTLTSIVELLKDAEARERYDQHLRFGIPKWKGTMYLYSRYRPTLAHTLVFILLAVSWGQWVSGWANYHYKHYTLSQMIQELKDANAYNQMSKVLQKKLGKTELDEQDIVQLVAEAFEADESNLTPMKPSWKDSLVVTLPKMLWHLIVNHKQVYADWKEAREARRLEQQALEQLQLEEEEEIRREEAERERALAEKQRMTEERKARKRAKHQAKADEKLVSLPKTQAPKDPFGQKIVKKEDELNLSSTWTPTELSTLSNLLNKHPGGTPGRWVLISKALKRRVDDVVTVVDKIKKSPQLVKDGIVI